MSGSCPSCAGADLAHTTKGKTMCLDCENTWGGKTPRLRLPPATPHDTAIARWINDMGRR